MLKSQKFPNGSMSDAVICLRMHCQIRRPSLDVKRPFRVRFLGEPAVDARGPQREKTTGSLFHTPDGLIFAHSVAALSRCDFSVIGKVVAASILLGGPPPVCFALPVADELVYGAVKCSPPIRLISDHDVAEKLEQVANACLLHGIV